MTQPPQDPNTPQNPVNPQEPVNSEQPAAAQPVNPEQPYGQQPAAQPYGQQPAPEEPKKSKTGLIIGLILGLVLVIGIVIALVLVISGNQNKIKTFEDLSAGMTEVGEANGMEHCHNYDDTLLAQAGPLSEEDGFPEDTQAFICSSIDLTSMEAVLSIDSSEYPKLMLGVFSESTEIDSNESLDLDSSSATDGEWVLRGDHWGVYSTDSDAKDFAQDKLGGELSTGE